MPDEHALLARARRFEAEALAEIHDRHFPVIFRHISFRVSDPQAAEDLASEVFARLLAALRDRGAPQTSLTGWLYRTTAYVVADYHRRGYRAKQSPLDDTLPSYEAGPAETLETRMKHDRLREALANLTPDQQATLDLRFGQAKSIQQTAAILGKTEAAVKQLQARALAALRKRLGEAVEVL